MRPRLTREVVVLITAVICSVGLGSPALAEECSTWATGRFDDAAVILAWPKQISVTVREGVITNSSPAALWDAEVLKQRVTLEVDCGTALPGRNYDLLEVRELTSEGVPGEFLPTNPHPPESGRYKMLAFYTDVSIASIPSLYEACGDDEVGLLNQKLTVSYCCEEHWDGGSANGLVQHWTTVPILVQCKDLLRAETTPILYRHECPIGYFVADTRERVVENESADRPRCILEGTAGMKACPFVYTRASAGEPWVEQDTILTHQVGAGNARTQRLALVRFSGEILIRELDRETSFFDSLAVEVLQRDGSREVLLPLRPELLAIDGSYLVTEHGDEVVIRFEEPSDGSFVEAELVAHGYYVPYDSVPGETTPLGRR